LSINRIIKQDDHQFTMVPNMAVRDPEITSNAFRLLAYLLSHENGYQLVYSQIMNQTDLGKFAIQKAIELLTDKGFLKVEQTRTSSGSFGGYDYILTDPYKSTEVQSPDSGQSASGSFRHGTTRPLKENKVIKKTNKKENKERLSPKDEILKDEFKKEIDEKFPNIDFTREVESFFDWIASKGVSYKDHKAAFRNWARKASEWNPKATASLDKEKDWTANYLREQEELSKQSAPAPKCKHGKNVALCRECVAS